MKIIIDENAGFCWGVVQTIEKVEKALEENPDKNVSVIGEIIHNTLEIKRLEEKKLSTINYEDIEKLDSKNSITVIRAHGEPPKTYNALNKNNITFIDATCPLVKKLQEKIRYYYLEGWQIIIY
ncbi:MAG: 4-hydroxy-3-methylbut-2-enyl diphosphate reductase, partial [Bacteroidetes bacterium]|nr:4-hydroxy-3-methylbut-2-enyl diphosphate reductase [Bacteroidota bacterium]